MLLLVFAAAALVAQQPASPAPQAANPQAEKLEIASLAQAINSVLAPPQVARADWGIDVVSLADGRELYAKNADHLFLPASNYKLLTIAATFAEIGGQHRFHTTIEAAAPPDQFGRIAGDLFLVGRGDPNLSSRNLPFNTETERMLSPTWALENFADQIVRAGVKQVDGGVVGDDTFYPWEPYAVGWTQDDLQWYYAAPVSALSLNDNMIMVTIRPGEKVGDPAYIAFTPWTKYYRVENKIATAPRGTRQQIAIQRWPGHRRVEFWGTIPLGGAPDEEQLAIDDPALFSARILKGLLQARGIQVLGAARAQHRQLWQPAQIGPSLAVPESNSAGRAVLASLDSAPLYEDLVVTNKVSQNLHAELDLRLLGKVHGDGSLEAGLTELREFLSRAGLQPQEYSLQDGSGLSREDLISPAAMCRLLRYAAAQPWGAQYAQTLPLAGVDGSLRHRFLGEPAAGRVQGKTGGVAHVRAISGYATTLSGQRVVFCIFVNNFSEKGGELLPVIDSVVNAIVQSQ